MSEFTSVGTVSAIGEGELGAFEVGGTRIAVANVEGTFYAFNDTCTHEECSLADGDLEGTNVVCPCHGSSFDVTNGRVVTGPAAEPVESYQVKVEGEELQIEVDA